MIESLSLEEEKIVITTKNLFRLTEELNYTAIKDISKVLDKKEKLKPLKI